MGSKIGNYFHEAIRSIVGTPKTKNGRRVSEWLLYLLMGVAFVVIMMEFARTIGY